MSSQKSVFLESEGDRYFERNKDALAKANDPLLEAVRGLGAQAVLEVGCANGWRLAQLGGERYGIDPSAKAVAAGIAEFGLQLRVGTADALPFADGAFDLVMFGFCLYLCDRSDLFRIAAEADRVLRAGHIAILDFHSDTPRRNEYRHREGVYSYKMDYAKLFTWHPSYTLMSQQFFAHDSGPDSRMAVSIIRKE